MASLLIAGGTVIDGVADKPVPDASILIEGDRIKAIVKRGDLGIPQDATVIDARGKFVIPGLMNANVHLLGDVLPENLARHMGRYEDLIAEAAQVALKGGLTTVFDTWGPRRFLTAVRDRINAGAEPGSRIFCAGNIIGFDGPFSPDFVAKAPEVVSQALVTRINAIWVENVGRHLMWLPSDRVASEVRSYIAKGVDFIKYASNEHGGISAGAFIVFAQRVQAAIVEEAHRAGITSQAHTTSVEGLRVAIDVGCDLIQHVNLTGPVPIPTGTLDLLATGRTGAVVFPLTDRLFRLIMENAPDRQRTMWSASDTNVRNLIRSGASLLLATDGALFAPEVAIDPALARFWGPAGEDRLIDLATGHIAWFKAMEEKGCRPMDMLRAATINIALAYGKDRDLGTLEAGKIADVLILDTDPLAAAENYRGVHMILKEGTPVDRDALPVNPILTRPMEPTPEEETAYIPFLASSGGFPMCPTCMRG